MKKSTVVIGGLCLLPLLTIGWLVLRPPPPVHGDILWVYVFRPDPDLPAERRIVTIDDSEISRFVAALSRRPGPPCRCTGEIELEFGGAGVAHRVRLSDHCTTITTQVEEATPPDPPPTTRHFAPAPELLRMAREAVARAK